MERMFGNQQVIFFTCRSCFAVLFHLEESTFLCKHSNQSIYRRYESSKKPLNQYFPNMPSSLNALSRSVLAGACAVTCCNPIWVVKTRLQLQTDIDPELISFSSFQNKSFLSLSRNKSA